MSRSVGLFALAGLLALPVLTEEASPPWSMADA
jgi:hypothetical protein